LDPIAIGLKEGLKKGKIGLTFALEGSWLLDGNPDWVDSLYHLGVRMIGPAHRFHNSFFLPPAELEESLSRAPSFLHPESTLSESGIALIDRMIARGMLIDVSHLPEAAFWQVVKINDNRTPLIASHANAYALCPVVRNLKKAQIEAIVESNGLIGICFHQKLLGGKNSRPGIPELVDHLVYMLEVAGEDQVALGSDLEGLISPAVGLERLDLVPGIRLEMKKRGISQKVIEKVMWENALQLF
jgi:membrane dipeptidase